MAAALLITLAAGPGSRSGRKSAIPSKVVVASIRPDGAAFPTLDPDAPSSIFSHLGRPLGRRSRHFIDRSRQNKLIHDTQLSISLLGDPLTRWGQEEA